MSRSHFLLNVRIWRYMCVLVSLLVLVNGLFDSQELLVSTKWGLIRGKWSKSLRNRLVANFLGIPYALPPVGELRFKSPQRWNRTWTTIRNATADGKMCTQINKDIIIGSEDCLYLNIFVPYISDKWQKSEKLPVLIFVHGGGFKTGSSNSELFAPDYLMDQDIIFVTINYRLSALGRVKDYRLSAICQFIPYYKTETCCMLKRIKPKSDDINLIIIYNNAITNSNHLGFFSTTNQVSPGNYGIKDVKMALEWVQENIHNFQGNPKSVTLMGHSAGSAITHFLALSQKTEGLFHRYILQSASVLSPCAIHPRRKYRQTCLKLAKLVGCLKRDDDIIALNKTTAGNMKGEDVRTNIYDISYRDKANDEEIMKCLRAVDARKLISMTQYLHVWRDYPLCDLGPTLEDVSKDAIITMHPSKVIKNRLFRDIPAMFQVVQDEGLEFTLPLFIYPEIMNELIENFEKYLPYFISYHEVISNTSAFASAIEDFYFNGNVTLAVTHNINITKMVSDAIIIWSMFQALQYQSELGNSSIYFSYFTYKGTFSHTFKSGIPIHVGVDHGDDLNYLFPIWNRKFHDMLLKNTEDDITMINIMTEMWANFVTNGIPKAKWISAWPNYRDHREFMRFGIDGLSNVVVQTDFLSDRMEFWKKLFKVLVEPESDVFFSERKENIITNNAMNCRLLYIVQFALPAIIYFYI